MYYGGLIWCFHCSTSTTLVCCWLAGSLEALQRRYCAVILSRGSSANTTRWAQRSTFTCWPHNTVCSNFESWLVCEHHKVSSTLYFHLLTTQHSVQCLSVIYLWYSYMASLPLGVAPWAACSRCFCWSSLLTCWQPCRFIVYFERSRLALVSYVMSKLL